jgi:hypothetical protein
MKQESGKEQAHLQVSPVLQHELCLGEEDDGENEEALDSKDHQGSPKEVHLI